MSVEKLFDSLPKPALGMVTQLWLLDQAEKHAEILEDRFVMAKIHYGVFQKYCDYKDAEAEKDNYDIDPNPLLEDADHEFTKVSLYCSYLNHNGERYMIPWARVSVPIQNEDGTADEYTERLQLAEIDKKDGEGLIPTKFMDGESVGICLELLGEMEYERSKNGRPITETLDKADHKAIHGLIEANDPHLIRGGE